MGTVIYIVLAIFWVWMLVDFFETQPFKDSPWTLVVFFGPLGAVIYFFAQYIPVQQQSSDVWIMKKRAQELESLPPDDVTIADVEELADLYFDSKQWDKALKIYPKILDESFDQNKTRYKLAKCHELLKQFEEAVEEYKKINTNSDELRMDTKLQLCRCLCRLEKWTEALLEIEEVAEDSNAPEVSYHHAICLLQTGRESEAKEILERIVKMEDSATKFEVEWVELAKKLLAKIK